MDKVLVNDALRKVLEHIPVMDFEEKSISECIGQISAEDIYADFDLPLIDISIPDGYAVISDDIKGARRDTPVVLRVIGTVSAGHPSAKKVKAGSAIRIMTGAVIPTGADCVVRFEDTDEPMNKKEGNGNTPKEVKIYKEAMPGENIRAAGSNIRKGDLVMSGGTVVGPTQISALISTGRNRLKVIRKPVLAIIATGDELISAGNPLSPGRVYNSNAESLAALISYYGGIPKIMGIARDREASLLSKFKRCMNADAIVTSGGVSEGDYDLVRRVIGKIGKVISPKINMGHGTVAFGVIKKDNAGEKDAIPVFSLSGPPSGCLINFIILVRHAVLKMRGHTDTSHPMVEAVALDQISSRTSKGFIKWTFLEKVDGKYIVKLNFTDNPMDFTSIVKANSVTMIAGDAVIKAGDRINVLPLEWRY